MKKILITGGSGYLGKDLIREFSDYEIAATYFRNPISEGISCDVSDFESIKKVFGEQPEFDVVINNAGVDLVGLLQDNSTEDIIRLINTNLTGAILISKICIPYMLKKRNGAIINISSIWGTHPEFASCEVAYAASKAGLIGFTKALAKEVGGSGINVNAVAPGMLNTSMNDKFDDETKSGFGILHSSRGKNPTTSETARLVRNISENTLINGQVIEI